jgi:hypothetical protein
MDIFCGAVIISCGFVPQFKVLIGGEFLLSDRRTTHIEGVHANDLFDDIGTQDLGPLGLQI